MGADDGTARERGAYLAAHDLTPVRRGRYLEKLQRKEPEVHRRVVALLDGADDGPDFLDTGGLSALSMSAPLPERIGPYRVLSELGRGGMGVVYEARRDDDLDRRVALKVIRPEMSTPEWHERFRRELRALALMSHPSIARVFDAGISDDGRPYYAMELVDGQPIQRYCDAHELDLPARLELFQQVCDGVAHAHQRAVIHRDLKPSNILVTETDDGPVPKIIDFGIAKLALDEEQQNLTATGVFLGTPNYASPELLMTPGELPDTRADVYSLGVVLYELLTGSPPFVRSHPQTSSETGRTDGLDRSPPRPSARARQGDANDVAFDRQRRSRQLRGDLDWIVLRALEVDPNRRYASVADLSADITRYHRHQRVIAARPSALYVARKFFLRHRLATATVAGIAILVAGFSWQSQKQLQQARREAQAANFAFDAVMSFSSKYDGLFVIQSIGQGPEIESAADYAAALDEVFIDDVWKRFDRQPFADDPGMERVVLLIKSLYLRRGAANRTTLELMRLYGEHLNANFRTEDALVFLEHVYTSAEREFGPDAPETLRAQAELGYALLRAEDPTADEMLLDAHRRSLAAFGPDDPVTALAVRRLSSLWLERGEYERTRDACSASARLVCRARRRGEPAGDRDRLVQLGQRRGGARECRAGAAPARCESDEAVRPRDHGRRRPARRRSPGHRPGSAASTIAGASRVLDDPEAPGGVRRRGRLGRSIRRQAGQRLDAPRRGCRAGLRGGAHLDR